MFDHLVQFEPEIASPEMFKPLADANPAEVLDAQFETAQWLDSVGVEGDPAYAEVQQENARNAFTAITAPADDKTIKARLAALNAPAAVKELVGMLTAYDWAFVEQAQELRGYVVAKLVEESANPKPQVRLKALELLGKVTEVGLFTERVEVKRTGESDKELDDRIREKLQRFVKPVEIQDAIEKPVLPAPDVDPDEAQP
jgi:hypothetical protein